MLALIVQATGYGFAAGTSPGPLISYLINVTLAQGWRHSIHLIFAPLISDGPIILLMTFVLKDLPEGVRAGLNVGGGLFVLWIAWGSWQQLRRRQPIGQNAPSMPANRALLKTVMMNFLSPGPYIFWGAVTGPLLIQGLERSVWHGLAFLAAFYGTFLSVLAGWVFFFDRARRMDDRVTRALMMVTIGVLVILGLALVAQGLF